MRAKHEVDIKCLLDEYDNRLDEDSIHELSTKMAALLRKELPENYLEDIDDILADLDDGNFDTPAEFDGALDELYEWGDLVKVAFGPKPKVHKDEYPTGEHAEELLETEAPEE